MPNEDNADILISDSIDNDVGLRTTNEFKSAGHFAKPADLWHLREQFYSDLDGVSHADGGCRISAAYVIRYVVEIGCRPRRPNHPHAVFSSRLSRRSKTSFMRQPAIAISTCFGLVYFGGEGLNVFEVSFYRLLCKFVGRATHLYGEVLKLLLDCGVIWMLIAKL